MPRFRHASRRRNAVGTVSHGYFNATADGNPDALNEFMTEIAAAPKKKLDISLHAILLATDLSQCSEKALTHAAAIARHYGSKLYLMHVVSPLPYALAGPDPVALAHDLALRDLRDVERRLMVAGAVAGVDHAVIVMDGDVWEAIAWVATQKKVGLVVIGTHGRTGIAKVMLGSRAEQIFRNASCPVLTVGLQCPSRTSFAAADSPAVVLFPTDFTKASLKALPYAVSFANEQGAMLVMQHILKPVPESDGTRWYSADDVAYARADAQNHAIERLCAAIRPFHLDVAPTYIADFGEPAEKILAAAENLKAKVITMGLKDHAHSALLSHTPWSVASQIVRQSNSPVLTVRA